MRSYTILSAVAASLLALLTPAGAGAWGAAHVGYTHVGPNGVYHAGATRAYGGYGAYGGYHAGYSGYGGYHAGYGGYHSSYGGYGGYHYSAGYGGGGYHYGYR